MQKKNKTAQSEPCQIIYQDNLTGHLVDKTSEASEKQLEALS